jgi:hypothetical protein
MDLKLWIRKANEAFKGLHFFESEYIGWEIKPEGVTPYLKKAPSTDESAAGGTTEYFAIIKSGSGLTYVADIYNEFASDMTFTAITPYEADATVKVPDGMLDDNFDLSADEVYMVAEYDVDGTTAWVMTTRPGIS